MSFLTLPYILPLCHWWLRREKGGGFKMVKTSQDTLSTPLECHVKFKWTLNTNISDDKLIFFKVFHGGSVLDPNLEVSVRKSDVTTFRGAFESIMRAHYPTLVGHVVIKCVPCPGICSEALAVLSSLSPYRFVPIYEFCMFAFVTKATFLDWSSNTVVFNLF